MLFIMLLSFIRFFSFIQPSVNLNETERDVTVLKAKKNEVWRFPFYKSDIQGYNIKDISIWWFADKETTDCNNTTTNIFKEKAGFIDFLQSEKYATITIIINDILGKGFTVFVCDEMLFESNVDTIEELQAELAENCKVVNSTYENDELTIKLDKCFCSSDVRIEKSELGRELADVELTSNKVSCCVLDKLYAEIKMPSMNGCYRLALRVGDEEQPIAISQSIQVTDNLSNTVLLEYFDESSVFGQRTENLKNVIRIPAIFKFIRNQFETNERLMSSGSMVRTNTKIYDVYSLTVGKQDKEFNKTLLCALNHTKVSVDGIDVFLKEFNQGESFNERYVTNYILWNNDKILKSEADCSNGSCSYASIETDVEVDIIDELGNISGIEDIASFESGCYCLKIYNKSSLLSLKYNIYKNDLKTDLEGIILANKSKTVKIKLSSFDKIKIKSYEQA